jgi:hypothetical protein
LTALVATTILFFSRRLRYPIRGKQSVEFLTSGGQHKEVVMRTACRSKVLVLLTRRLGYGSVLGVCLLGLACNDSRVVLPAPTAPIQASPEPSPPPAVNTAILAGAYALTMEFPSACAAIPELAAPRKYEVTLEPANPYPYLTVRVAAGGYTRPTVVGDLWPTADGHSAQLSWNNFDFPGCDGSPEPLSGGRTLMVCGDGGATIDGRTILAEINGEVFIEAGGVRQRVCGGTERLTFSRVTP